MIEVKAPPRIEAVSRIKQLVRSAHFCMYSTSILQWPMESESLKTQWVDNAGNIWFINNNEQHKKEFFARNGNIQLFYSNASKSEFLNVFGVASVSFNSEAMDQLLPNLTFQTGPLTLIKVVPTEVYWWDENRNDMVPLIQAEKDDGALEQKLCA